MAKIFVQIKCSGRGPDGQVALKEPIPVTVGLYKRRGTIRSAEITVEPKGCPFNVCGGKRCKASHPDHDGARSDAFCPFNFDFPYCRRLPWWKMPVELKKAMAKLAAVET